jgi:hypothetical protein
MDNVVQAMVMMFEGFEIENYHIITRTIFEIDDKKASWHGAE